MASVNSGEAMGRKKKGFSKTKKKSTSVDMTAMVDVAFLLLTFFVLTAMIDHSTMIELVVPPKAEEDIHQKIREDKIMTIVLEKDDKIYYYVGITQPEVLETNFSSDGLRKVLLTHLNAHSPRCESGKTAQVEKGCWDPIFIIKPTNQSRYKVLVDLLDELAITNASKYAIDEFTVEDSLLIYAE